MKPTDPLSEYYVMDVDWTDSMLLQSIPEPPDDMSWTLGTRFKKSPSLPVIATICTGYENETPVPFSNVPPIMSSQLSEVILNAGVQNLDLYEAILESEDGSVQIPNYKAYNVVGLISAAELSKTEFDSKNPSRYLDASIDKLEIDPGKISNLLLFRLAEFSSALIVHSSIKDAIEKAKIPKVYFTRPSQFKS